MGTRKKVPASYRQQVRNQRICCLLILCCGLLCINLGEPLFVGLGSVMAAFSVVLFVIVQVAARRVESAAS